MLGWELGNWTGGHTGLLLPLPGPLATAGAMTTKPGASSNGNVSCQTAGGQESEIKVWTGSCSPPQNLWRTVPAASFQLLGPGVPRLWPWPPGSAPSTPGFSCVSTRHPPSISASRPHIGLRSTHHLVSLDHLCKDPVSRKGHIRRCWGSGFQ